MMTPEEFKRLSNDEQFAYLDRARRMYMVQQITMLAAFIKDETTGRPMIVRKISSKSGLKEKTINLARIIQKRGCAREIEAVLAGNVSAENVSQLIVRKVPPEKRLWMLTATSSNTAQRRRDAASGALRSVDAVENAIEACSMAIGKIDISMLGGMPQICRRLKKSRQTLSRVITEICKEL